MATKPTHCPIWGDPFPATIDHAAIHGPYLIVDSPRAGGRYQISNRVKVSVDQLSDAQKARLTTLLIDKRMQGDDCPSITSEVIEYTDDKAPLIHPDRADRLLRFIANETNAVDPIVTIDRNAYAAYAWSESIDWNEVSCLLGHLVEKRWLELRAYDCDIFQSKITAAGQSRALSPPRLEFLLVRNFRALRRAEFRDLTPLTVLLGPNGSGKSTVLDVFAFLSECFETGLRGAWERRGRGRELKSRDARGPVEIEIRYRERPGDPRITYRLAVDDPRGHPVVETEQLSWRRGRYGRPFHFLDYRAGQGRAASGEFPDEGDDRVFIPLQSPDLLAVSVLGQFAEHPRVAALRDFITGWHVSYLATDNARGQPQAGPQERLSDTGDNLANVIQHLAEQSPERLEHIFEVLRQRVPRIERVLSETMPDGRLLLQIKDAPFSHPVLARFASDGTLKMLAYLVLLHDPEPPPFIGIEEPENFLHPRLLWELAEECRAASEHTQLLVTTHSPFFLNALRPREVRVLWRDEQGYTQTARAADLEGVNAFTEEGAQLGYLWMEGQFGTGDPLVNQGGPTYLPDDSRQ